MFRIALLYEYLITLFLYNKAYTRSLYKITHIIYVTMCHVNLPTYLIGNEIQIRKTS